MRIWSLTVIGCLAVSAAWAQGTFTIRSPKSGAVVREVVKVHIPRNSVPTNGYIGFFVNDKFVEATVPPVSGQDYVYTLDTKAAQIPDGKLTIEAVLYVDYQESPKIVNRSNVAVTLDNAASIRVPAGGFTLRYRYAPGTEWIYDTEYKVTTSTLASDPSRRLGRAAEIEVDRESFRMLYGIDNVKSTKEGREALVRQQLLPPKGSLYIDVTTALDNKRSRFRYDQVSPVYLQVTDTGREVFGSLPLFFPWEGSTGAFANTHLISNMPLPVLPSRSVKPGDSWQSPLLFGLIGDADTPLVDYAEAMKQGRVTVPYPARGEFLGIEWERGFPCAKLKQTSSAQPSLMIKDSPLQRIDIEQYTWFALSTGRPVRIEYSVTADVLATGLTGGSNFNDTPGGGPGPGPSPAGGEGGGKGLPGLGGGDLGHRNDFRQDMPTLGDDDEGMGRGNRRGGGRQTGPGNRTGGPGGAANQQIVRIRASISMKLATP